MHLLSLLLSLCTVVKVEPLGDTTYLRLQVMKLLLLEKERRDAAGWRAFQGSCQTLKLQRTRARGEARELEAAIDAAARAARLQAAEAELGAAFTRNCLSNEAQYAPWGVFDGLLE